MEIPFNERMLIFNLFPQLRSARWGELKINELAADLSGLLGIGENDPNPFLDPDVCEQWKNFIHKVKGIDYSYGGYMEDRSLAWRGHYHEPDAVTHLGVDHYVPAGTEVHMPVGAMLLHAYNDPDPVGGWGGRLLFKFHGGYLLFGHLKNIVDEVGKFYGIGDVIGVVAESFCNGGWSPHLHTQCMSNDYGERHNGKFFESIDGYTKRYPGIENDFPEPCTLLA